MHLGKVKEWGSMQSFDLNSIKMTGNSQLGELVLKWLGDDLKQRGPRNQSQADSYPNLEGKGGYGTEKREE